MKETIKSSRTLGYLEKLYRLVNAELFDGELEEVVITVQSTPKTFGHVVIGDAWNVKGTGKIELNIGAGTLDRDIENIVATLVHECCHLWNYQHGIKDTSSGTIYHNSRFKATAEAHGLVVVRSDRYGWSHTTPSDSLVEWCIEHELPEIRMNRNDPRGVRIPGGDKAADGAGLQPNGLRPSSTRKLVCPCCGQSVRATKKVNILCGDCLVKMVEV